MYTVKGMAILDNDGNRILAKYYDDSIFPTIKEQKAFEKNLFNRTHRANAEIIMLDGITCLYKSNVDLFFYVMGSSHENEVSITFELHTVQLYFMFLFIPTYIFQLLLMSVLQCMYDSISQILRKNVEKRIVLDNLDVVMLALDEICDNG